MPNVACLHKRAHLPGAALMNLCLHFGGVPLVSGREEKHASDSRRSQPPQAAASLARSAVEGSKVDCWQGLRANSSPRSHAPSTQSTEWSGQGGGAEECVLAIGHTLRPWRLKRPCPAYWRDHPSSVFRRQTKLKLDSPPRFFISPKLEVLVPLRTRLANPVKPGSSEFRESGLWVLCLELKFR